MNKVVARHVDGHIVKGSTGDCSPMRDVFHVLPPGPGEKPIAVCVSELKAVFFVRDLAGNPKHEERKAFDPAVPAIGRKMKVEFRGGEVLVGTTQGYAPGRPGFFLVPADPAPNNERCYIVSRRRGRPRSSPDRS